MPARIDPSDSIVHRMFAIITGTVLVAVILLATVVAFTPPNTALHDFALTVLIADVIVGILPSFAATWYLWHLFRLDPQRSWLLLRDALIASVLTAAAVFLGVVASLRLMRIPIPWAGGYLVAVLVITVAVPIYMASVYYLRQRNGRTERKRRHDDS